MNITELKDLFKKELASTFDHDEIESFFYILTENYHDLKRSEVMLKPKTVVDGMHLKKWKKAIAELQTEKPIQYILKEGWFFGYTFYVNENVLIPRSETEELVEWIIEDYKDIFDISILDIGTGSGCIPITLKKELPRAIISTIDISEKAITIAQKNALQLNADIEFIHQDILKTDFLFQKYDVIVSNPPYVRHLEKDEIKKNVLDYEPHLALFVENEDALLFYRKIALLAKNHLTENGKLYFEINQYLGKETVYLLSDLGFKNIVLKKDLKGNDRMIRCNL